MDPKLNTRLAAMKAAPDGDLISMANKMEGVIKLQGGDPDFDTPQNIKDALSEAMNSGKTHYPPTHGVPELRNAIAEYYQSKGVAQEPSNVIVTSGSGMALNAGMSSVLNPGDEVILPEPYYMAYANLLDYFKVKRVSVPLVEEDGFRLDTVALEQAVTPKTKMILICNPNNPTGTVYNQGELEAIRDVSIANDLLVFSDDVYLEFAWNGNKSKCIASLPGMAERTIITNSFSKTFAMTGWRLGFIVAPPSISSAVKRLPIGYRTNTFVQHAGVEALTNSWSAVDAMMKEFDSRRKFFVKRINEIEGVSCVMPEGSFYTFPRIETKEGTTRPFCGKLLRNEKILIRPGDSFGDPTESNVRIPLIRPVDVLERVAEGIERQLKKG
jgi:aspartate/methionine/tyrosine aminotransferase